MYDIHPNGIKLIDTLPAEYNGKPYDYFLKLKQDVLDAEVNFKELVRAVNTSTLESAEAVKKTAKWTLLLFIATTVMAVATIVLAIYPAVEQFDAKRELQRIQDKVQQIEERTSRNIQTKNSQSSGESQKQSVDSSKKTLLKR